MRCENDENKSEDPWILNKRLLLLSQHSPHIRYPTLPKSQLRRFCYLLPGVSHQKSHPGSRRGSTCGKHLCFVPSNGPLAWKVTWMSPPAICFSWCSLPQSGRAKPKRNGPTHMDSQKSKWFKDQKQEREKFKKVHFPKPPQTCTDFRGVPLNNWWMVLIPLVIRVEWRRIPAELGVQYPNSTTCRRCTNDFLKDASHSPKLNASHLSLPSCNLPLPFSSTRIFNL